MKKHTEPSPQIVTATRERARESGGEGESKKEAEISGGEVVETIEERHVATRKVITVN